MRPKPGEPSGDYCATCGIHRMPFTHVPVKLVNRNGLTEAARCHSCGHTVYSGADSSSQISAYAAWKQEPMVYLFPEYAEKPTAVTVEPRRGAALLEALEIINGERADQYGDPKDSFALIAKYWTVYLEGRGGRDDIKPVDVAAMMVLFKLAREANQHKHDNWVDLLGYGGIAAGCAGKDGTDEK